jgi:O-antigen/teichoic acid export membrane protein
MEENKSFFAYLKNKFLEDGVQRHSKNLGWMFFAKIGSMVITFVATAFIARHLGPTNYGQLSYAVSFVSLFSFIASLGIDQILHRDLIKYPEKRNELLGSAIGLRMIASLIAICIVIGFALFVSSQDVSLLLILIISLSPLFGAFQLLGYEFQAETKSKYPSLLSLGVVLVLNILKIITIFFNKGVIYLALIVLLEPLLYSLGYLYLKKRFYKDVEKLSFKKNTALTIIRDSFPLIFASAFSLIYTRIDQVMIKHMIDSKAVGLYDAAVRISELSYFIPNILLVSLFPAIINAKKVSSQLYLKRLKKLLFFLLIISTVISLGTTLISHQLISIIFGEAFMGALPALYICIWSTLGSSLNQYSQQILIAENLTKKISVATFLGMVTNVVLNIYLIPLYGILGASFATLISYMVPFFSLFLFKKTRKIMYTILTT